jgi:anti-sigma factor RsiW
MCDERERLIGFVYDECSAAERREVEQHVDGCPTCRVEIAGLRRVREDLLAWEVPEHPPVWRPSPVVKAEPWWRRSTGWSLAAAAAVILLAGVAGGAATRAMMPGQAAAVTGVSAEELNAVERQIVSLMREELARVRVVVDSNTGRPGVVAAADPGLERRLEERLSNSDRETLALVSQMWKDLNTVRAQDKKEIAELRLALQQIAAGGGR